jgi:hypothetical protein
MLVSGPTVFISEPLLTILTNYFTEVREEEKVDKANYKAQTKQINYYELMALKKESETAVLTYVECLREQATGH